jgi:polyhydroxybutyrate depolymerase
MRIRSCVTLFLFTIVGLATGLTPVSAQTLTETTHSVVAPDGATRWFKVFTPSNLGNPAKVVIVLHGGGLDYDQTTANSQYEWRELATEQGILVVYPNGTKTTGETNGEEQHWNDCRTDAGTNNVNAGDVGFMNTMLDWLQANYNVDQSRVYAVGTSNGGMMSYRLAREMSDRIAAIAVTIANNPEDSPNNDQCIVPPRPIPVMIINGTKDKTIKWAGGCTTASGCVKSALHTRDDWLVWNLASTTPSSFTYTNINTGDGTTVTCDVHAPTTGGAELRFCRVNNGGHSEPSIDHPTTALYNLLFGKGNKDIETARKHWEFLSTKVRPW